ncbi:non-homologous end-joining DNA ligase [Rugosimonospora africana]|uniref:ATP-dependent DNA ligase n=1 Tax=Rugosimonospora africana TaxID=556532 RepID=A0A8J3VUY0_9ACTN|nr:non-homologous end-joining DNA ligase [Rugosimonospora africana]GIH20067.1 ATP-dependent DNA ligase [Rugosimonospora africana]
MTIALSRPDKLLFPGVSKADLADYYDAVARRMLPHLRGRPLARQRFPDGIDHGGFMEKQVPADAPDVVHRAAVPKVGGGEVTMLVCDNAATLRYLANQAAITLHTWLARARSPRRPDRLILDLDPPAGFAAARSAALAARELFAEVGLDPFVMTTGSRGLHVTAAIAGRDDVGDVLALARDLAGTLADRQPRALTTAARKADRGRKLYVDALRNGYAQHAVAPYAVRPLRGAPVATPLHWDELDDRGLTARTYTIRTVLDRDDPWADFPRRGPSVAAIRRRLAAI